ncbi:MAG: RHS repeat-associated core domain-containing protein [Bacteroidota bacterium]
MTTLINSIANGTAAAGTFVDGGAVGSTGGATVPWSGFLDKTSQAGTVPKAYLNYVVFDSDYNYVTGNFVALTSNAREYGQHGPHERLACEIPVKSAGYVYIYLSNDNVALGGRQVEVYFDDFKVSHVKSPIVQPQDYYPFGLTYSVRQREGSMVNLFQHGARETEDELNLGWTSYGARMYSSDIGRWTTNDGFAESYFSYSPYNYVRNNPVLRVDPTGEWDITIHLHNDREQYGYGIAIVTDRHGNEVFRFAVRAEGTGGRNRSVKYADTPLGVYDIPDKNDIWRASTKDNRQTYGRILVW